MVRLVDVDNTCDLAKPISTATQLARDAKQIKSLFGKVPTTNVSRLFDYGDNKLRAISVNSPLSVQTTNYAYLTIQANCYTKTEVDNSLALKAPINDPTFTGTVGGLSKQMVQFGNVDNTSDLAKPISTATQLALDAEQIQILFGEVPTTNLSRLFDYGDNKFRAIHVNSPLSVETTNDAYLTIRADCYTRKWVLRLLTL